MKSPPLIEGEVRMFTVYIDQKGAREALDLLNRSLNTLEPVDWPAWAAPMVRKLEELLNEAIDVKEGSIA